MQLYLALTNPSVDRYGANPDARNILVLVRSLPWCWCAQHAKQHSGAGARSFPGAGARSLPGAGVRPLPGFIIFHTAPPPRAGAPQRWS